MKSNTLIAGLLLTAAMSSQAQEPHDDIDLLLTAGFAIGGDDLAEVEYDHGSDEELEAGSGVILGIGAVIAIPGTSLDAQVSFNYHGDSVEADDGDASMERTALDALLFYHAGPHRIGGGITHHSDIEYDIDVDYLIDQNVEFDDATGLVIEYNYIFNNFFAIGIRHTDIEYEDKMFGEKLDASHVAFLIDFLI